MLKQGENISGYRIERQLFEHATSSGFLVVAADDKEFRLLVDHSSVQWNRTRRKQFQEQVKLLRETATPGTCRPLEVVEEQGLCGCLYPVPLGNSLVSVALDSLSAQSTLELVRDIADCLDTPHEAGQSHGNLSLETVYIQDGGFSCLADFALWSLIPLDFQAGILPLFASPEQIRGEDPGTTSDIYSLGCLFYYLLTKKPPYAGEDAFATGLLHLNGTFPDLPEPLRLFDPLIKQMVSGERMTAGQVRDEAVRLLQEEAVGQLILPSQESVAQEQESVPDDSPALTVIAATSETDDMIARIEERLQRLPEMLEEQDESSPSIDEPTNSQPAIENSEESTTALPKTKDSAPGTALKIAMLATGLILGVGIGFMLFGHVASSTEQGLTRSAPALTPDSGSHQPDLSTLMRHWQRSDFAAAQKELKRLIDEFPNDYRLYNNLAALQAVAGELDKARESLEKAVLLEREFAVLYNNLSTVYTEIARDSYGRALEMDTPAAALYLDLFTNSGIVNWSPRQPLIVDTPPDDRQEPASANENVITEGRASSDAPAPSTDTPEEDVQIPVALVTTPPPVAPPVEKVIPEPVTRTVVDPQPVAVEREDPATVLQRWAAAWMAQDIEGYLSFYAQDFDPGSGLSRAVWESQRRQRLTRPENIEVTLSDFQVRDLSRDKIEVEVMQGYRSDRYSDRTRKLFVLATRGGNWVIEREESLEVFR